MTLLNWEHSILCWKLPLGALDDPMEAAVAGTLGGVTGAAVAEALGGGIGP